MSRYDDSGTPEDGYSYRSADIFALPPSLAAELAALIRRARGAGPRAAPEGGAEIIDLTLYRIRHGLRHANHRDG